MILNQPKGWFFYLGVLEDTSGTQVKIRYKIKTNEFRRTLGGK